VLDEIPEGLIAPQCLTGQGMKEADKMQHLRHKLLMGGNCGCRVCCIDGTPARWLLLLLLLVLLKVIVKEVAGAAAAAREW
jgi:hypothetical protein